MRNTSTSVAVLGGLRAPGLARAACAALLGAAMATSAQATVVGFNTAALFDFSDFPQVSYLESGYKLSFDAFGGSQALVVDGLGSAGSPGLVALSGGLFTLARADGGLFSLLGLEAGRSPFDISGLASPMLGLQGLMGLTPVATQDLLLTASLDNFGFGSNWTGLSALRFTTSGDALIDNISVLNVVPEPASWALLALAMGGLALTSRARAQVAQGGQGGSAEPQAMAVARV